MSLKGVDADDLGLSAFCLRVGLSAGTIQLNHEWTLNNTHGKPPENTRFMMSLKGTGANDVGWYAFSLRSGSQLSTLGSQLHRSG